MAARSKSILRFGLLLLFAAACVVAILLLPQPRRFPAGKSPGHLGGVDVSRLPSGEDIIVGLCYFDQNPDGTRTPRDKHPTGSRTYGVVHISVFFTESADWSSRWVQPYEITILRSAFGFGNHFESALTDSMFLAKHAKELNDPRLHRMAAQISSKPPILVPAGDKDPTRIYRGSLIIWPAVWWSVTRIALWGLLALCLCIFFCQIRAELKRRRGGCPSCGYDLGGLPPGSRCPECGQGN